VKRPENVWQVTKLTINVIRTEDAPTAAPYSQGFVAGGFVFTAGQVGKNLKTGEMPEGVADQTRQSLENIKAILEAAGASMDDIVKTTVFLTDMAYFEEMNDAYVTFFEKNPPARSTVQVKLASDAFKVEIEAIAYVGK